MVSRLNQVQGQTRIFCFYPIEGSLGSYAKLAKWVRDRRPLYGFTSQPTSANSSLEAIVRQYAAAIGQVTDGQPCRLFGYSFGGFLAMKVAAALEDLGHPLDHVTVVDWVPFAADAWSTKVECLADYLTLLHQYLSQHLSASVVRAEDQVRATMITLVDSLLEHESRLSLSKVYEYFRATGLLAEEVRQHALEPILAPLLERLPLLRDSGLESIRTPLNVWRADRGLARHETNWAAWTSAACHEQLVQGDHLSVMKPPCIGQIAHQLCLDR